MNRQTSDEDDLNLGEDPRGLGTASPDDINLQIDTNLPVGMNKNRHVQGLQIIEEEKTPQSASIPSPGVAVVASGLSGLANAS